METQHQQQAKATCLSAEAAAKAKEERSLGMGGESAVIHIPSTASTLPAGWRWERLDEICDAVIDCPHSTPVLTADGPFIVRSQDMRTGVFRMEEAGHVSEETYRERIVRAEPRYGDLLYSREGTYFGIAAEVPHDVRVCLGQRMVLIRPIGSKCSARFLRYWLNSPIMGSHIHGYRDGTVAERLNLPIIRQLPVAVPPLPEQRAIAHILGTLDDKIELNRRMNETLEAMARALFKSWFIDFDPVRRNAARSRNQPSPAASRHPLPVGEGQGADGVAGEFPSPPGRRAGDEGSFGGEAFDRLFPDSFEDSELGEIPKGWTVSPLHKLTGYLSRGIGPAYVEVGGICVLNQKCVRDCRIDFSKSRRHDPIKKSIEGRTLRVLDILVNSTGVGTLGRMAQLWDLPESAIVDSHVTVIRAAEGVNPWFLGIALIGREEEVEALGEGSTGQTELSRTRLGALACMVPPAELQASFGHLVAPLLLRLSENEHGNTTLAALRDTLLPKLISGELRVRNVERLLGSAT